MQRILILTSKGGGGLLSAAQAISETFCELGNESVEVVDFIQEVDWFTDSFIRLYNYLLTKSPVWDDLYMKFCYSISPKKNSLSRRIMNRRWQKRGIRFLESRLPDVIVLMSPTVVAGTIPLLKKASLFDTKAYTLCVDIGEKMPDGWANSSIRKCFAASEDARRTLVEYGQPADSIEITGIPVRSKFKLKLKNERNQLLNEMGLNQNLFTILVTGSKAGARNVLEIVSQLSHLNNIQLIVVCGQNQKLYHNVKSLLTSKRDKRYLITGFTDKMEKFMAVSDLIITKGGALTIAEALVMQVPLVIDAYPRAMILEYGNVKFIKEKGLGIVLEHLDNIVPLIQDLTTRSRRYQDIGKNLSAIQWEDAARKICKKILIDTPAETS